MPAQRSILIVDDTPQNLLVLTNMLEQSGYHVRPAINGELALQAVQRSRPDVILLDIMMPEMDGYEVCRRLKAEPTTVDIPVIFISAFNELEEKLKAFQMGGVDYITKPFQAAEVLLRVNTHLNMNAMQQQLREQNILLQNELAERKRTEALLYQLQKAVETTEVGITITDPQGNIVYINPADAAMHGYTVQELIGQRSHIFAPPAFREEDRNTQYDPDLFSNWKRERLNVRKDGSEFPVTLISNPIFDKQDELIGNVIVCEEITERKKTEKTLRDQAILLRGVAGAMNRLLVTDDLATSLAESLELLGFATGVDRIYIYETHHHPESGVPLMSQRFLWAQDMPEVLVNTPSRQNLPYRNHFQRWYDRLSQNSVLSGIVREFPVCEREILEEVGVISILVVPITIHQKFWGFIGFDNCQTERQWNEEEESILLAMAGSIGGAIARQQAEENLIAANQELQATLHSLQQAQNQLILSEKMAALGQLIAGIAHEINTPLGAIRSSIETISTTLNQTVEHLPAFLNTLPPDQQAVFFDLLRRARQRDVTLSIKEERELRRRLVPALETRQIPNARKIAELLVNLGVYTDIEFLVPILQNPEYPHILDVAYRLAGLQESTQTILTATDRAATVVFALKTYARYDYSGEMATVNLIDGIDTVLTLYQNQLKHGVEVVRDYAELPPIPCYPDELNQVWTNLIHNALYAMRNQGTLTIRVAQHDQFAVVAMTDTGSGIPEAIQARIFEPFFTTKPAGEGSGLGLDIVKKIIDKHQGSITVESRPGQTTFQIRLPMCVPPEPGHFP